MSAVQSILDESWRTGDKLQDEWLARPENKDARATSSRFAKEMRALDDLHSTIAGGAPRTANTDASKPYGGSLTPGGSYYYDQHSNLYQGSAPENYYNITPGSGRHGPTASLVIDARAPLAQSEVQSRNSTDQFFASRHGVTTQNDVAWAQQFPGSATAARVSQPAAQPFVTPLPPLDQFSTTPADARAIAAQYGTGNASTTFDSTPGTRTPFIAGANGQDQGPAIARDVSRNDSTLNQDSVGMFRISDPRPGSKIEWPSLPPSPVDQNDHNSYR